ncbi:MAG: hypothetical protein ACW96U_00690 [Candidatus Heimdallarchaeaceae archaeon]|jgi:hypothetical protein
MNHSIEILRQVDEEGHFHAFFHKRLFCMIVRPGAVDWDNKAKVLKNIPSHASIHLCGYVGVMNNHPAFGHNYSDWESRSSLADAINNINVHGGLTYSGFMDDILKPQRIYVLNKSLWFLGFDCAHSWDLSYPIIRDGVYRDLSYVKEQVIELAEELIKIRRKRYVFILQDILYKIKCFYLTIKKNLIKLRESE